MTHRNDPMIILQEHRPEIEIALQTDIRAIKEGKAQDAILFYGMAHNMSTSQIIKVGRHRGRNWRFMAALADASLEIEGQGMLHLMRQVVGDNLLIQATQKSIQTILKLSEIQASYAYNPHINEMLERAMNQVSTIHLRTVEDYWNTFRR